MPLSRASSRLAVVAVVLATAGAGLSIADDARPPTPPSAPSEKPVSAAPAAGQTTFASTEAAAKALFAAFEKNDDAALRAILGPGAEDLVQDGTDPAVAAQRAELVRAAARKTTFESQPDGHVTIVIGEAAYPLALPLVKDGEKFRVDAAAGRRELLTRRVGENELEAVGVALHYADAQEQYANADRDGDGVKEYARRVVSTPGAKDGLYWAAAEGEEASPIGRGLVPLREALDAGGKPVPPPFNGYYWRVLEAQGPNAPGGAHSYVINGNMIAGFALLGVPAVHRNTGVTSFLVSHHGKVYEKDLGPDGLKVAAAIAAFDPDPSWREIDERTLRDAAGSSPKDAAFVDAAAEAAAPAPAGASAPPAPGVEPGPDPRCPPK